MRPKKEKTLADLLDGRFADGYEQFQQFFDDAEASADLTTNQKAFGHFLRLLTVAMTEGLNRGEEQFGPPPDDMLINLWGAAGAALAGINAQAFEVEGFHQVRKLMRDTFMRSYRQTTDLMVKHAAEVAV